MSSFFELFHRSRYLIANACPEHPYPSEAFVTGFVELFDIQDHTPPLLPDVVRFLSIAREWMQKDPENVLVCHCRGGKGRTGSLCCAWLLYHQDAQDAQDALNLFTLQRTDTEQGRSRKLQGVDTPSQRRYVGYVDAMLRSSCAYYPALVELPGNAEVRLRSVTLRGFFATPGRHTPDSLLAVVHEGGGLKRVLHASPGRRPPPEQSDGDMFISPADGDVCWDLEDIVVRGDTRMSFFDLAEIAEKDKLAPRVGDQPDGRARAGKETGCLFYFLFHTSFLQGTELTIPMSMVDKAFKNPRRYAQTGVIELSFASAVA